MRLPGDPDESEVRTVLVVDDDEQFRYLAEQVLESAGFRVLDAGNIRQCLAVLRSCKIDAVLLDVVMPDRDGIEALPQLKAASPRTKIVTVSGSYASEVYLRITSYLGADASLDKSEIGTLHVLLDRLLSQPSSCHRGITGR